ncbi:MAG: hypothetical protein LBS51_04865 [Oscillospiraceae bacterium]|jgi:hypothetical protein|nr:hypothetical protein [Oscillospiraceae bacterium]
MKTNKKRILGIILAIVLAFSAFGGMALADPMQSLSLVQLSDTQYTTFFSAPSDTATLYATQTSNYQDNQPFTSAADADAVTWGWTDDGSTIYSTTTTSDGQLSISATGDVATGSYTGPAPDYTAAYAGWYALAEVTAAAVSLRPAVYSLQGQLGTGYPINFTIVIQSASPVPVGASNISAYVTDNRSGIPLPILAAGTVPNLTVTYPDTGDVLDGVPGSLQNDPSATGSLQSLLNNSDIDDFAVNTTDAHVIDLTDYKGNDYPETQSPTFYGWQYGVYRLNTATSNYEIVGISTVVNPSVFPLQTGDKVYWQYGAYSTLPTIWPGA